MKMYVGVYRAAESLHEGDRATLGVLDVKALACAAAKRCEDRAQEGVEHRRDERAIVGEPVAERERAPAVCA
jgi:hypothetical protein